MSTEPRRHRDIKNNDGLERPSSISLRVFVLKA
jgi:hypothetical protein